MTNSVKSILKKLDPYWDYIARRPLSDNEINQIETAVGLGMPACLKEFLATIGLFQDLVADLFRFPQNFENKWSEYFSTFKEDDTYQELFPYGDDGAGNLFALRIGEAAGHIYFIDHERLSVFQTEETFFQWLENAVDAAIEAIKNNERKPNSQKAWCVQFSFGTNNFHKIFEVMRQVGSVELPDTIWGNEKISPVGVKSTQLVFKFDNQANVLKCLEYSGWETSLYFFDMEEVIIIPRSESRIHQLDILFKENNLGYKLIDYGPLFTSASS